MLAKIEALTKRVDDLERRLQSVENANTNKQPEPSLLDSDQNDDLKF